MASSIMHYAVTKKLLKNNDFKNPDRLILGSLLPDAGENRLSHLKVWLDVNNRRTYDLEKFRMMFFRQMEADDLYLGYYLHLVQDIVFRHFVYDKYDWHPQNDEYVKKLHNDYRILNAYLIQKYQLENNLIDLKNFEKEPLNKLCAFDLDGLSENMKTYFLPSEEKEYFFFREEMADEYIAEAVEVCLNELEALKRKEGMNSRENAWQ